jgi:hypothetical protein
VTLGKKAIYRHGSGATWVQLTFGQEGYAKIKSILLLLFSFYFDFLNLKVDKKCVPQAKR